jgi:hypothetical protein
MHVLIQDRVIQEAREPLRLLLAGQPLTWDQPPMADASWRVFAGVCSGIAQVVRLFGKEVAFDQWGDKRRLTLTSLSWAPLPYGFGWWIACRPFGGVSFSQDPSDGLSPLLGVRYLDSWPFGFLLHDELDRFVPLLRELVLEQALRLQALDLQDGGEERFTPDSLEAALLRASALSPETFVDLHGLGADADLEGWHLRRALHLLCAAAAALERRRDLICLGY